MMMEDVISPIVLDDEMVRGLAESVYEIHHSTVSKAGFDLTDAVSDQRRDAILGMISSVLTPTFTPVFGQSPEKRYADIFDQISDFAEHLSKRHIFADGNKRITMQMALGLLTTRGITIDVPDTPSPAGNMMYRWIQDVVTGARTRAELSAFLRDHAMLDRSQI